MEGMERGIVLGKDRDAADLVELMRACMVVKLNHTIKEASSLDCQREPKECYIFACLTWILTLHIHSQDQYEFAPLVVLSRLYL